MAIMESSAGSIVSATLDGASSAVRARACARSRRNSRVPAPPGTMVRGTNQASRLTVGQLAPGGRVCWGELPICAAWPALGVVLTWILARPACRSYAPNTSSRASGKASRRPADTGDFQI